MLALEREHMRIYKPLSCLLSSFPGLLFYSSALLACGEEGEEGCAVQQMLTQVGFLGVWGSSYSLVVPVP